MSETSLLNEVEWLAESDIDAELVALLVCVAVTERLELTVALELGCVVTVADRDSDPDPVLDRLWTAEMLNDVDSDEVLVQLAGAEDVPDGDPVKVADDSEEGENPVTVGTAVMESESDRVSVLVSEVVPEPVRVKVARDRENEPLTIVDNDLEGLSAVWDLVRVEERERLLLTAAKDRVKLAVAVLDKDRLSDKVTDVVSDKVFVALSIMLGVFEDESDAETENETANVNEEVVEKVFVTESEVVAEEDSVIVAPAREIVSDREGVLDVVFVSVSSRVADGLIEGSGERVTLEREEVEEPVSMSVVVIVTLSETENVSDAVRDVEGVSVVVTVPLCEFVPVLSGESVRDGEGEVVQSRVGVRLLIVREKSGVKILVAVGELEPLVLVAENDIV